MTDPAETEDVPIYALPVFVKMRATASRKRNQFKSTSRLQIEGLLAAVENHRHFVSIAGALPDVYWSDVFRDLLRARARGLVRDVGDDQWELTDEGRAL